MSTPTTGALPEASPPLRFAVVDVETSGLSVGQHRILQIGLVVVEVDPVDHRSTEIARWSTMIRLRWPWQRLGPRRIHGIRRRDLRGAPQLADALRELQQRLDGAIFTAHNAGFDAGFLEEAARTAGFPLELGPLLCTLRLSRRLDTERSQSHRLSDVCTRYGVTLDRPHDALEDAAATAAVLPHLLRAHGITRADQLRPFLVSAERAGSPAGPPDGSRPQLTS